MSPSSPDRSVVERHLAALDEAVTNLRRHTGIARADLDQLDLRWTIERGLALCAQNALDVATHLASSLGRDAPDYASAIDALAATGVIPADFGRAFRSVAGFRNALVHGYLAVDLDIVHEVLTTRLDDFERFAQHVTRWLLSCEV